MPADPGSRREGGDGDGQHGDVVIEAGAAQVPPAAAARPAPRAFRLRTTTAVATWGDHKESRKAGNGGLVSSCIPAFLIWLAIELVHYRVGASFAPELYLSRPHHFLAAGDVASRHDANEMIAAIHDRQLMHMLLLHQSSRVGSVLIRIATDDIGLMTKRTRSQTGFALGRPSARQCRDR